MLVVPAASPIPEKSSQSTNLLKLKNLISDFEVKRRRFFLVLSMHKVAGSIPAFSSMHEVALIDQLRERQTEDNVSSHLKAPCSIHSQSKI